MPLKFATNQSLTATTALPSAVPTDNLILISTQTASNSATISFTSGLDSTYDEYIFKIINVHPSSDGVAMVFQGSTNGGSSYGVTITSTVFRAYHDEADSTTALAYDGNGDLAQGTGFQEIINAGTGSDNDQASCAYLQLFNPSSTTYVKHFLATSSGISAGDFMIASYTGGYFNTTSAINAIQFKFTGGNIDDGTIKLYGVKKS
jgi:hypothetical protein